MEAQAQGSGDSAQRAAAVAPPRLTYHGVVVAVHDGDSYTVDCDLGPIYGHDRDLGMGLRVFKRRLIARVHVRLAHYNAAELGTPGGDAAYSAVADILTVGSDVGVRVLQPDNYGMRWDAEVTLSDGRDLGELLYTEGWVAPYEGTGPKPIPPYPPVTPGR